LPFNTSRKATAHAVYQTREFRGRRDGAAVSRRPLCFAETPTSPYQELADLAARSNGRSVSLVNRIGPAELKGFGTIAGKRHDDDPRLIDVSLIIEKLRCRRGPVQTSGGWA
jgi:hypothetical protein